MGNTAPPFVPKTNTATPPMAEPSVVTDTEDTTVSTEEKKRERIVYTKDDCDKVIPLISEKSSTTIAKELGMDKKVVARIVSESKKLIRKKAAELSGGMEKAYVKIPGRKPGTEMPDYAQPLTDFAKNAENQIAQFLTPPPTAKSGPKGTRSSGKSNLMENETMANLMASIEGLNS